MLAMISVIVVLLLVFIAMVLIWRQIMTGQVTHATTHLRELSQDYLKRHEELKDRQSEGDKRYQDQIESAKAEGERLRAKLLEEAEAARVRLVAEGKAESERLVNQALAARDVMQQEMDATMSHRAVAQARQLVQEILPAPMRQIMQAQWVEELMEGLKALPKLETAEPVKEVRVASAFALTAAQRQRLQAGLEALVGHPVTLQETVEESLLAGLMLTAGHLVLDGTLTSKLEQAARSLHAS
jgi:F-type H+-transporting ATPase subunit b